MSPRPRSPSRERPVVVVLRPNSMDALAATGLDVEFVEWRRGEAPPPGLRADILFGGYGADEGAVAWAEGARWIQLSGVGTDNVQPGLVEGRIVTNTAGVNAVQVAELAFATMIAFAKDIPAIWSSSVAPGAWEQMHIDVLDGRTLGILGFGHIGRALSTRAQAFGMTVLAHTRTPRPDADGVRFVSKEELAAASDHLVIAATANASTRHIVDGALLELTRPGVHLVNVARGSLLDQEALRPFLDDGRVARASLDTVDPEPLPEGHWLRDHPSVKLSPHVGGVAPHERMTRATVERFAENVRRFTAGEELHDVVHRPDEPPVP